MIAVYRAALALARGDVAGTVRHARRALDLVAEDDHRRPWGGCGPARACVLDERGSRGGAPAYAEGMAELQRAGHLADVLGCAIALADIRIARVVSARRMRTYEQALQLATTSGGPVLRGTADMYVGMSELHRERNDLEAARQHLLRSQELGEHAGLPQNPYRWRVAMARSGRPKETWTARSSCSTRRSACTSATSFRTCGRSRR